jgi:hypothetical protein
MRELGGIAHADQVASDEAAEAAASRHNVAPEVGGSRIAVLKDNRRSFALVNVGHALALDLDKFHGGERLSAVGHSIAPLRLALHVMY